MTPCRQGLNSCAEAFANVASSMAAAKLIEPVRLPIIGCSCLAGGMIDDFVAEINVTPPPAFAP
jgi:hypothetical protein